MLVEISLSQIWYIYYILLIEKLKDQSGHFLAKIIIDNFERIGHL
jgi:hypothetical protein